MKALLTYFRTHLRLMIAGFLAVVALAGGIRLSLGPVGIDNLRPMLTGRMQEALPGTKAEVGHLDLAWFSDANALGLIITDLRVTDRKGRVIASAAHIEAALAADSLILGHLAPARLSANDFFAALAVSPEGRYELGFEAHGKPGEMPPLDALFLDMTGPETLGRPVSFAREVRLREGKLVFNHPVRGQLWDAEVEAIAFTKRRGKFSTRIDMNLTSASGTARLRADGEGVVDLKQASLSLDLDQLIPAEVFPDIGSVRPASYLAAPVSGHIRLSYSASRGFDRVLFDVRAGQGFVRLGNASVPFAEATIDADYDPVARKVRFGTLKVKSGALDTDLQGSMSVTTTTIDGAPHSLIDFDVSGPSVTGRLASDFPARTLSRPRFTGRLIPAQRRLEITSGEGSLGAAPLTTKGVLYLDETGQLGADLVARIDGHFTKEDVFAFWPEHLAKVVREDLIRRIQGGDYANADFTLAAKPGHLAPGGLEDADLRLDFDFKGMGLLIEPRLQPARDLAGHATLKGDSFQMDVTTGKLNDVALHKGGLLVPQFHFGNSRTHIWLESRTRPQDVMVAIDPLTDGALSRLKLEQRLTGDAQARVDIRFPTFHPINNSSLDITFSADIANAGMTQAALGWDMTEGTVHVEGSLLADRLSVSGPAKLGPYQGRFTYDTQMTPVTQLVTIDGHFDASPFGGSPQVPVAITGAFSVRDNVGQGSVTSDIFTGKVNWSPRKDPEGRPREVNIDGAIISAGMQAQGLPIFDRLPRELPTRISLLRSGEIWRGNVDAQSLSGEVAYIEGERPRLVYRSVITPEEARELGYGALPLFREPRHLTVNVDLNEGANEATIGIERMSARLGWTEVEGDERLQRRLSMVVLPKDWETLGLPPALFSPSQPTEVTAQWQQSERSLDGTVVVGGHEVAFVMPVRHSLTGDLLQPPSVDYSLRIFGLVDRVLLDRLGYRQNPITFSGAVEADFRLYDREGYPSARLDIDAEQAVVGITDMGWQKPAGSPGVVSIDFVEDANRGVKLSRIEASGSDVSVSGSAAFDGEGRLSMAEFATARLPGLIDAALRFTQPEATGMRQITLSGRSLDLRAWMKRTPPPSDAMIYDAGQTMRLEAIPAPQPPLGLSLELDDLYLSDVPLNDVRAEMYWDGANALSGQIDALAGEGYLSLSMTPESHFSRFSLTTDDMGALITSATGFGQLRGGRAVAEGVFANGQIDAQITGRNIRVLELPVLAQLLSVASLEGIYDTLNGDGIAFRDFNVPIRYRSGLLFVRNGWARGRALGFNVWGTSDFRTGQLDFTGTLIPAYGVNSLFGDVRTNGLGLLGLQYDIRGPYAKPEASVNPLTIMLPGFVRKWAGVRRADPIPPIEAVSSARAATDQAHEASAEAH